MHSRLTLKLIFAFDPHGFVGCVNTCYAVTAAATLVTDSSQLGQQKNIAPQSRYFASYLVIILLFFGIFFTFRHQQYPRSVTLTIFSRNQMFFCKESIIRFTVRSDFLISAASCFCVVLGACARMFKMTLSSKVTFWHFGVALWDSVSADALP